ncbi:MAG: nuclear transport factor 2 family protein [Solirubrobacterales bacterium]
MAEPHRFRRAAEAKDLDLMREALVEDVVLNSPTLFRPFEGRDTVLFVLSHVAALLEDFRYTGEASGDRSLVLRFTARVAGTDREIEGIDYLELDAAGRVRELTVFMRPYSAVTRFKELMGERFVAAGVVPGSAA